jgi:hypothetical protein
MFSVHYRDGVQKRILQLASADARIIAGAVVGSLALGEGDRWSDLDLTFGVMDGVPITELLEDWTRELSHEIGAIHLFDLPSGTTTYRVFLLPDCLQLDLSFTPALEFGAAGPKFRLLFGQAVQRPFPLPPSPHELFGYGVHHSLRARFAIERGRYWQAEYWISGTRDHALSLACCHCDLSARFGRGFDDLPPAIRESFCAALVRSLDRDELLRALTAAVEGLLREAAHLPALTVKVGPELRKLLARW